MSSYYFVTTRCKNITFIMFSDHYDNQKHILLCFKFQNNMCVKKWRAAESSTAVLIYCSLFKTWKVGVCIHCFFSTFVEQFYIFHAEDYLNGCHRCVWIINWDLWNLLLLLFIIIENIKNDLHFRFLYYMLL